MYGGKILNSCVGLLVGVMGGLLGLGGAELRLPYLIGTLRLPPHDAVKVNLAVSLFTVAAGISSPLHCAWTSRHFRVSARCDCHCSWRCCGSLSGRRMVEATFPHRVVPHNFCLAFDTRPGPPGGILCWRFATAYCQPMRYCELLPDCFLDRYRLDQHCPWRRRRGSHNSHIDIRLWHCHQGRRFLEHDYQPCQLC